MGWFEAIILGLVQGLTEFLPISSSAHVFLVGKLLFDGHDPGAAFTAVTQLGTEAAVLVYFWHDIVRIIKQWTKSLVGKVPNSDPDVRMGWLVILGSLPIMILGLVFKDLIEGGLRNLWITAAMLGGVALVMGWFDTKAKHHKTLDQLSVKDGLIFGFAQACALIPGVSRSGGTITAGLAMGYTRDAAARYSFLLAIPAVLASGFLELVTLIQHPTPIAWGPIGLATLIAFLIGYAVISWLLRFISTHSFRPFVIYRIALALGIVALLVTGTLEAALPSGA